MAVQFSFFIKICINIAALWYTSNIVKAYTDAATIIYPFIIYTTTRRGSGIFSKNSAPSSFVRGYALRLVALKKI